MEYRSLGSSGCAVSSLALGTMTFGAETDEQGSHAQLDRFVEAGGILVDTADVYSDGESEQIIGRWFAQRPTSLTDAVVLATKGRFPTDDSPNGAGLSARHLVRAVDASLRRLGVDTIDVPGSGYCPGHRSAAAGCRASTSVTTVRPALPASASIPPAGDYPYGVMGVQQRERDLAGSR